MLWFRYKGNLTLLQFVWFEASTKIDESKPVASKRTATPKSSSRHMYTRRCVGAPPKRLSDWTGRENGLIQGALPAEGAIGRRIVCAIGNTKYKGEKKAPFGAIRKLQVLYSSTAKCQVRALPHLKCTPNRIVASSKKCTRNRR